MVLQLSTHAAFASGPGREITFRSESEGPPDETLVLALAESSASGDVSLWLLARGAALVGLDACAAEAFGTAPSPASARPAEAPDAAGDFDCLRVAVFPESLWRERAEKLEASLASIGLRMLVSAAADDAPVPLSAFAAPRAVSA